VVKKRSLHCVAALLVTCFMSTRNGKFSSSQKEFGRHRSSLQMQIVKTTEADILLQRHVQSLGKGLGKVLRYCKVAGKSWWKGG
jgi:hypothetical protein